MTREFLKDVAKYLPAQLAPALVSFISIPIITTIFPPAEYGNYILAMTTLNVFATLNGWAPMSVLRFYPAFEKEGKARAFVLQMFRMAAMSVLILCAVYGLGLLVARRFYDGHQIFLMQIGMAVFLLQCFFDLNTNTMRARRQIVRYSACVVWNAAAAVVIGLGLIHAYRSGIDAFLWGAMAALALVIPLMTLNNLRGCDIAPSAGAARSSLPPDLTRKVLLFGLPVVLGNLELWALSLSDRFIIEHFRGSAEVGIYSACSGISERSIRMLSSLLMAASAPLVLRIWEMDGPEKTRHFLSNVTRIFLIVCIPSAIGLAILARPVTNALTGPEYHSGYIILPWAALGAVIFGTQHIYQYVMLIQQKTSTLAVVYLGAGAINILINILAVPYFGYEAAIASRLVAYVFLAITLILISRHYLKWKYPFATLVRTLGAGAAMGALVFAIAKVRITGRPMIDLFCIIGAGALAYGIFLLLFREAKRDELRRLFG